MVCLSFRLHLAVETFAAWKLEKWSLLPLWQCLVKWRCREEWDSWRKSSEALAVVWWGGWAFQRNHPRDLVADPLDHLVPWVHLVLLGPSLVR